MSYSILADENIERATVNYLNKLGHDIVRIQDTPDLGQGATDDEIVTYANRSGRLILSQDDDFFTDIDPHDTPGVLAQRDQQLSAQESEKLSTRWRIISYRNRSSWRSSAPTGFDRPAFSKN